MKLKKIEDTNIFSKIILSILGLALIVSIVSVTLSFILFLNINHFKTQIENKILHYFGYKVSFGNLYANLTPNHNPHLVINDFNLTNPKDPQQNFALKKLEATLSYSSIWHMRPLFNNITLSGSTINLIQINANQFSINGFVIKSSSKSSDLNLDQWLDGQKLIDLSQVKLIYTNKLNNLPTFTLNTGLKVSLDQKNDRYQIDINNISLTTPTTTIFKNKSITGKYIIGHGGNLSIAKTRLEDFNPILRLIPTLNKIELSGNVNLLEFYWANSIFKPEDIQIKSTFQNIGIVSGVPNIPSLNNISGNVDISEKHGYLNLALNNSTLDYAQMFLVPYKFKNLSTQIEWQNGASSTLINNSSLHNNLYKESNAIVFTCKNMKIQSVDFNGELHGQYIYTQKSLGYLQLNAKIDRVLIKKIGNYLPKIIGVDTLTWLNSALQQGYGVNGVLDLSGPIEDFPYTNNKGRFYIDANIENGTLGFAHGWPTLDNIYGVFQIRNQKILIKTTRANVMHNQIESATVLIPDMTAKHLSLIANGNATGATNNFVSYLIQSPLNALLGEFPALIAAEGSGKLKLHLNIPLDKVQNLNVNGTYTFNNNNLKLKLPIPELTKVNGNLNFFESGIAIKNMRANALNSEFTLGATTSKNNSMHFKINSNNLDFKNATQFYFPLLSPVINGRSPLNINFIINSSGLHDLVATSNLEGVMLNMPQPLGKTSTESANLWLNLDPTSSGFDLGANYNNCLNSLVEIDSNGDLTHAVIEVNSKHNENFNPTVTSNQFLHSNLYKSLPKSTEKPAKIDFNIDINSLYINSWIETLNSILSKEAPNNSNKSRSTITAREESKPNSNATSIYPIKINLKSTNTYLGEQNFKGLEVNTLITHEHIKFKIDNNVATGYGDYALPTESLNIHLYKYNFFIESSTSTSIVSRQESSNLEQSNVKHPSKVQSWISYARLNLHLGSVEKVTPNYKNPITLEHDIANNFPIEKSRAKLPKTHIHIDELQFESRPLGHVHLEMIPSANNLIFKNGKIESKDFTVTFNGVDSCFKCRDAFTTFNIHSNIENLGVLVQTLGLGEIIFKGTGKININSEWNGDINDFTQKQVSLKFNANFKQGSFLKLSTSSNIASKMLGLLSLQTITNLIKLDFSGVFSNGFYFETLDTSGTMLNNIIHLKSLIMKSPLAAAKMYGDINLNSEIVNLHLIIIPKLSTGVAVGAAVATLNPVVGVATYAAEELFNNPFSKLFSLHFHITGSMAKPSIEKEEIAKQIVNNVTSTVGD